MVLTRNVSRVTAADGIGHKQRRDKMYNARYRMPYLTDKGTQCFAWMKQKARQLPSARGFLRLFLCSSAETGSAMNCPLPQRSQFGGLLLTPLLESLTKVLWIEL